MTTQEPRTGVQVLSEAIERAEKEVIRLCNGRDRSFRMTIPADPDRDSDLLIMAGLKAGRDAIAALASKSGSETVPEGLREALAEMRQATSRDEAYDLGWNDAVQAVTLFLDRAVPVVREGLDEERLAIALHNGRCRRGVLCGAWGHRDAAAGIAAEYARLNEDARHGK